MAISDSRCMLKLNIAECDQDIYSLAEAANNSSLMNFSIFDQYVV